MTDWQYTPKLDRRVCLTGTMDGDDTLWTLPGGLEDDTLDTIVLGPDHSEYSGFVLTPDSNSGGEVRLEGDYTAGPVVIGRSYNMVGKPTKPFPRGRDNAGIVEGKRYLTSVRAIHLNTGFYRIIRSMAGRVNKIQQFDTPSEGTPQVWGSLLAWCNGNLDLMSFTIQSNSAYPVTITSIEYQLDHEARRG